MMSSVSTAFTMRTGLERGRIEFRQMLANTSEFLGWVWPSAIAIVVLYAMSGSTVPGTGMSLGAHAVPGLLGMNIVLNGIMGLAMALTMERDDGTLLRMKAIPNGMPAYLVGKIVSQTGMAIALLVIVLIPAAFMFDGLELGRPMSWVQLLLTAAFGLVAALPLGAIVGSLFGNAQNIGYISLLMMGLVAMSGVFYPISALPEWMQWVGQVFPIYWLGLGMRAALLPDAMAAAEVGGSWRQLETVGMLGAWMAIGFVVAPIVLRRTAARQSGARVSAQPAAGSPAA